MYNFLWTGSFDSFFIKKFIKNENKISPEVAVRLTYFKEDKTVNILVIVMFL